MSDEDAVLPAVIVALDPNADPDSFAEDIRTRSDVRTAAKRDGGVSVAEVEGNVQTEGSDAPTAEGESIPRSVQGDDSRGVEWVLPNGADVEIEGRDETFPSDRVEFTRDGWVKVFNKADYSMSVYPASRVEELHTYTKHVEEEEWF